MAQETHNLGDGMRFVDLAGGQFEQYEVIRELRLHGDVSTYLVWHTALEQSGAMTVLPQLVGASPELLSDFEDQLRLQASLAHPHLVEIQDFGAFGEVPYVTHRYIPVGTLGERLSIGGPLTLEEATRVIKQIGSALDFMHSRGAVHFGITPDTIFRLEDGSYALAGAALMNFLLEAGAYPLDTMRYSAPEVYLRVPYTPSVDTYALGAVFHTLLTGHPPFLGVTYTQLMEAHLNRVAPPLEKLRPDLPSELSDVLNKSLEKLAYLRHETAIEMTAEIVRIVEGSRAAHDLIAQARASGSAVTRRGVDNIRMRATTTRGENPTQLYADAIMMEAQDPARAADLYRRIIEVQPQRAQGEVIQRLYRLEQEFGLARLPMMMVEAREARDIQDWETLEAVTREVLTYDPDYREAQELHAEGRLMAAAAHHYRTAVAAASVGEYEAAIQLLRELYKSVPGHPDPEGLTTINARSAAHIKRHEVVEAHERQVLSLAFSDDNRYMASGSTDKTVRLWRTPQMEPVYQIDDHPTWVCSTIFNPAGEVLFAGTWEGIIKLWSVPEGEYIGVIAGQTSQVRAMSFASHNPSLLATASGYFLTLWVMPQGRRIAVVRESDRNPVTGLAFSPTEPLLVCGLQNGHLRIRSAEDPSFGIVMNVPVHRGPIYSVACSTDGRYAATASRDGLAKITDLTTGEVTAEMVGHGGTVHDLAFSMDGSLLASAGRDGTIILWDAHTGAMLKRLPLQHSEARSVAFSPDGRSLATGGSDGYIVLWRII